MAKTNRELEILKEACKCLKAVTPVGKIKTAMGLRLEPDVRYDALLTFEHILEERAVVVKLNLRYEMLNTLEFQIREIPLPVLLVTCHVTNQVADELCKRNIQFLDTQGNMYLAQEKPFFFVQKTGNRNNNLSRTKPTIQAFKGNKLQVVFVLLANQEAINLPYREIAKQAGVALGTVGWTFRDLRNLGYIRVYKNTRKLMNRKKLVNIWIEAYPLEIRPKLNPRRFTVQDKNWWLQTDLKKYEAVLGGEPAATVMTKYLHPQQGVLYIQGEIQQLAKQLKFKRDPEGNLLIMDKFWNTENLEINGIPVAPPLIVCAELLAEGNARNIETAEMIRENYDV